MVSSQEGVPPQDLAAERSVLGACLYGGPTVAIAAEAVAPSDFYRDQHGTLFATMLALHRRGEAVDVQTVASALKAAGRLDEVGGLDGLDSLVRATPQSANVASYARTVRDCAARRDLIAAGHRVVLAGYDAESLELAQAEAFDQVSRAISSNAARIEQQLTGTDLLSTWYDRTRSTGGAITTGFQSLDLALRGGWQKSQVHVLTARTSIGKSSLVCHFLSAAIDAGRRVGLATLEMPHQDVMARLVAMRTGIPYKECEQGPDWLASSEDRDLVHDEVERIQDLLVIDEGSGYGVAEMGRRLLRLRRHHSCDLIILDPFNRVRGEGARDYERRQSVNDELQRLGHPDVLGVPLIVVAQQNRDGVDGPRLDTIKGCGDIEEGAVVVLALDRCDERRTDGHVPYALHVLKNRGGQQDLRIGLCGNEDTFAWQEAGAR